MGSRGASSISGSNSSVAFGGRSDDGNGSSSNGSAGNGFGGGAPPPGALPWTYDYMLFILPRQYTGWSYTEVGFQFIILIMQCTCCQQICNGTK